MQTVLSFKIPRETRRLFSRRDLSTPWQVCSALAPRNPYPGAAFQGWQTGSTSPALAVLRKSFCRNDDAHSCGRTMVSECTPEARRRVSLASWALSAARNQYALYRYKTRELDFFKRLRTDTLPSQARTPCHAHPVSCDDWTPRHSFPASDLAVLIPRAWRR